MAWNEILLGGWRCAQLQVGEMELAVTLDVGPRIIHLSYAGGENLFFMKPETLGQTGGTSYRGYGGHRLWTSPEIPERTNEPDNQPVHFDHELGRFTTSGSDCGLIKSITILPKNGGVLIEHRIQNTSSQSWRIAPWAITVMRAGCTCAVPTPPRKPHGAVLLPESPMVFWPYASMADDRFSLGADVVTIRQDTSGQPTKVGMMVPQGVAATYLNGVAFVKRFGSGLAEQYPDFGVNFECFTRHDMLEVETLGPLVNLEPGEIIQHDEQWHLLPFANAPQSEAEHLQALNTFGALEFSTTL